MRLLIVTAAAAVLSFPALAQPQQQQQRPQQQQQPQQQPQRPAQQPPQQQAPQQSQRPAQQQPQPQPQQAQDDAPAPGMFACRTEPEVCYVAIVTGPGEVSVLYTNDPKAEGVEAKPIKVTNPAGAPADLSQHSGKVIMLTGEYNAQSGLAKVEVIDVAGPLLSFAIKSMLSNNNEEEEPEPPPPPPRQQPRQQPRR
jgi:hypothetical protein